MNGQLIKISRPPVTTGVTSDGWITRRPGDVVIAVYQMGAR